MHYNKYIDNGISKVVTYYYQHVFSIKIHKILHTPEIFLKVLAKWCSFGVMNVKRRHVQIMQKKLRCY